MPMIDSIEARIAVVSAAAYVCHLGRELEQGRGTISLQSAFDLLYKMLTVDLKHLVDFKNDGIVAALQQGEIQLGHKLPKMKKTRKAEKS